MVVNLVNISISLSIWVFPERFNREVKIYPERGH